MSRCHSAVAIPIQHRARHYNVLSGIFFRHNNYVENLMTYRQSEAPQIGLSLLKIAFFVRVSGLSKRPLEAVLVCAVC